MTRRAPAGIFIPPASWKWPTGVVAGVNITHCIETGKLLPSSHVAHSHTDTRDPFRGWMCVKGNHVYANPNRLSGAPNKTMLHELAHLIVGAGHTYAWGDIMLRLGVKPEQDRNLRKVIRDRAAAQERKAQKMRTAA